MAPTWTVSYRRARSDSAALAVETDLCRAVERF